MDIDEHIAHLRRDGSLLADAAIRSGGDVQVPTCSEWTVRDLVRHVSEVHRWAAATVMAPGGGMVGEEALADAMAAAPTEFGELVAWFRDGHGAIVDALCEADPAADSWHFLPAPSGTAFWARRQAHETAMHRVDAERATGAVSSIEPAFAVDGLDELLLGFMDRPGGRLRAAQPCTLVVHASDTGDAWTVQVGPDGRVVTREAADGDCVVRAPASDLYTLLWNRRSTDGLDVEGDRSILDLWRSGATIRWGA